MWEIGGGFIGAPGPGWTFHELIDLNADGHADIVFTNPAGDLTTWLMNDTHVTGGGFIQGPNVTTGAAADGHDNFGGNAKPVQASTSKTALSLPFMTAFIAASSARPKPL